MNKRIIITASIFGLLAVVFGAFGAHSLKGFITPEQIDSWQTAVSYQFYHTFALLYLSTFSRSRSRSVNLASWFFTIGVILFCGSIYLLSLRHIIPVGNISWLGPITPVGGVFFILGWAGLLLATLKNK